jgi:2-iminobutanoate/2-iminopropanoate deaminase
MNQSVNPKSIHAPIGAYSHSIRVPANAELLVIAGQVGIDAKGRLQDGARKQAEQAFRNVLACLKENGMRKSHLIKLTVFLTDSRHIEAYRAARTKVIGPAALPASTLLIVNGLASPDMAIEIEGMAAK